MSVRRPPARRGGLSLGAFGGRADLLDRFDSRRSGALLHAGALNNNPFNMSAGVAMLSQVFPPERAASLDVAGDGPRAMGCGRGCSRPPGRGACPFR